MGCQPGSAVCGDAHRTGWALASTSVLSTEGREPRRATEGTWGSGRAEKQAGPPWLCPILRLPLLRMRFQFLSDFPHDLWARSLGHSSS